MLWKIKKDKTQTRKEVALASFEQWVMDCKGVLCCFGTEKNFLGFSFALGVEKVRLLCVNSQTDLERLLL